MNNKLKELEMKIKALELEIELMKSKENYHTLYIIPETKPIQPKPDLGTGDNYPVWYPRSICTDENPTK